MRSAMRSWRLVDRYCRPRERQVEATRGRPARGRVRHGSSHRADAWRQLTSPAVGTRCRRSSRPWRRGSRSTSASGSASSASWPRSGGSSDRSTSTPIRCTSPASALVVGRRGILLLRHKSLGIWVQPEGTSTTARPPWDAAAREAIEETGLPVRLTAEPPSSPTSTCTPARRGHTHLDLRYLVEAGDADPSPPPGESQEVAWFDWPEAMAVADPGLAGALSSLAEYVRDTLREGA